MEYAKIDPKIKTIWYIRRSIFLLIMIAGFLALTLTAFTEELKALKIVVIVVEVVFTLLQMIYTFVFPTYQYNNYSYKISNDDIIIKSGVIFKSTIIVPFIQIQDIGFMQGLFAQFFEIAYINISTAGATRIIIGLEKDKAKEITEKLSAKVVEIKCGE